MLIITFATVLSKFWEKEENEEYLRRCKRDYRTKDKEREI